MSQAPAAPGPLPLTSAPACCLHLLCRCGHASACGCVSPLTLPQLNWHPKALPLLTVPGTRCLLPRRYDEFGRPRKSSAADREARERAALDRLQVGVDTGGRAAAYSESGVQQGWDNSGLQRPARRPGLLPP